MSPRWGFAAISNLTHRLRGGLNNFAPVGAGLSQPWRLQILTEQYLPYKGRVSRSFTIFGL